MLLVGGSRKCVSDSAQPDAKDRTVAAITTPSSYSGSESILAGPQLYHCQYLRRVAAALRPLQTTSTPHKRDFGMSHLGGLFAAGGVACSRLLAHVLSRMRLEYGPSFTICSDCQVAL